MHGSINPYAVLGVAPGSDDVVIRAAYRALMFKYHPDVRQDAEGRNRAAEINHAYDILVNPERRAAFDVGQAQAHAWGRGSEPPPPFPNPPRSGRRQAKSARPTRAEFRKKPQRRNWLLPTGAVAAMLIAGVAVWETANAPPFPLQRTVKIKLPSAKSLESSTQGQVAVAFAAAASPVSVATAATVPVAAAPAAPQFAAEINFRIIEGAVKQVNVVMQKYGIVGARAVSQKCHDDQSAAPDWAVADRCAAFDFAAGHIDREVSENSDGAIKQDAYFAFMSGNQMETYKGLNAPSDVLAYRVARIQNASVAVADEALARRQIEGGAKLASMYQ